MYVHFMEGPPLSIHRIDIYHSLTSTLPSQDPPAWSLLPSESSVSAACHQHGAKSVMLI